MDDEDEIMTAFERMRIVVAAAALGVLGPFFMACTWLYFKDAIDQAAWERANHCQVTGHTDPGVYPTNPRRAVMKCDGGDSVRPTE